MTILTTHIGSLPRPDDLMALLRDQDAGRPSDPAAFDARVRAAVDDIVRTQVATGLDIVNDGEQGKVDYSTYVKSRFTGFEGEEAAMPMGADLKDFPEFAERTRTAASERRPMCSGDRVEGLGRGGEGHRESQACRREGARPACVHDGGVTGPGCALSLESLLPK